MKNVIIMGAAGRDFHNFNVLFRRNRDYNVVAFTATQIPDIDGRVYPKELCGVGWVNFYHEGIPIYPEEQLVDLIKKHNVDEVIFSYSDVPYEYVMQKASLVTAAGADFKLLSAPDTMIKPLKPVISICAVRTGCGKSQTTRKVVEILTKHGKKVVVVRHPMPYGDLKKQIVQRFSTYEDFEKHNCTIEEREEYEPLVAKGVIVYAGVDYAKILKQAEAEADIIIWDGGNNDTPFFKPAVHIVILDPHRAGHELKYYPGQTNLLMADIAIVNKVDTALRDSIEFVCENIVSQAPAAEIILAESSVLVDDEKRINGQRVLIVEDGPTLTHGEMDFGAGFVAAVDNDAKEIIKPAQHAVGSIKSVFEKYPHIKAVLPAMGYGKEQLKDLEDTINSVDCDVVLFATPIDLPRLLNINKPTIRVRYEYNDCTSPTLEEVLLKKLL